MKNLFVFLFILLLSFPSYAFEAKFDLDYGGIVTNFTLSENELTEYAQGLRNEVGYPYTVQGLTESNIVPFVRIDVDDNENIESFTLKLELSTIVFVANDWPEGTCYHDAVLVHELTHVEITLKNILRYEPIFVMAIQRSFEQGKTDEERVDLANKLLRVLFMQMMNDLNKQQAEFDSPEEYERVDNLCQK